MSNTCSALDFPISGANAIPVLAALLNSDKVDGGIFYRITVTSMTHGWYFPLTNFESILLGLIVLQIFVMRYFQILPLDITKLIEKGTILSTDYSRKKRALRNHLTDQRRLMEKLLKILKRLDKYDCLLRTICELESNKFLQPNDTLPPEMTMTLEKLNRSRASRKRKEAANANNETIHERPMISAFEDAAYFGYRFGAHDDQSVSCDQMFSLCTLDSKEILSYAKTVLQPFTGFL